ncbi:SgcJ/EcaC family oxidoreductase [Streptomonospora halotolerans]|nr:SgcJ/EcaC family oxidoreductase [Streptomonospora nanhaiensis]
MPGSLGHARVGAVMTSEVIEALTGRVGGSLPMRPTGGRTEREGTTMSTDNAGRSTPRAAVEGAAARPLRRVLAVDGWSTAGFGVVLLAAARPLSGVLGLPTAWSVPFGVAMLGGAAALGLIAARPRIPAGLVAAVAAGNALAGAALAVLALAPVLPLTGWGTAFLLSGTAVVAVFAALEYAALRRAAARTRAEEAAAEERLRGLVAAQQRAWEAGDGPAFAATFTEDADFVAVDGSHIRTRAGIAAAMQEGFDTFMKDTRLTDPRTWHIRFAGPDVAVVVTGGVCVLWPGAKTGRPQDLSIQTRVAVREGGTWLFTTFQNGRMRPPEPPPER